MPAAVLKSDAPVIGPGLLLGWIARAILIMVTAFWLWFCILDGLGDAKEHGVMGFIMMLPAAVIVVGTLFVVWRWERIGAYLLLVVSALGAYVMLLNYQRHVQPSSGVPGDLAFGLVIFVLPFLLPAILLLLKQSIERRKAA